MNTNILNEYLSTGKVTASETDVQDAALVIVARKATDPMFQILANLCAMEMLAKDFHYRAKGKSFYGNHLFADLIWGIGKSQDDLNEIYYMGELQGNPPYRSEVATEAVKAIDAIPAMANEDGYLEAMFTVANKLVGLVEQAKEKKTLSGTTAILDKVSQDALQVVGFLKRVLAGESIEEQIDADAE